jgi:hypothetical protein
MLTTSNSMPRHSGWRSSANITRRLISSRSLGFAKIPVQIHLCPLDLPPPAVAADHPLGLLLG